MRTLLCSLFLLLNVSLTNTAFATSVWANQPSQHAQNPEALADPKQETLALEVMREIRCLQCQNQSIIDSNADLAKDLRKLIRLKISEGMTAQQMKDYLVARYGDWILLKPPVKPTTYLLWGSPLLLLVLIIGFFLRQRKTSPRVLPPLTQQEQKRLDDLLADTQKKLDQEGKGS